MKALVILILLSLIIGCNESSAPSASEPLAAIMEHTGTTPAQLTPVRMAVMHNECMARVHSVMTEQKNVCDLTTTERHHLARTAVDEYLIEQGLRLSCDEDWCLTSVGKVLAQAKERVSKQEYQALMSLTNCRNDSDLRSLPARPQFRIYEVGRRIGLASCEFNTRNNWPECTTILINMWHVAMADAVGGIAGEILDPFGGGVVGAAVESTLAIGEEVGWW